MLSLLASLNPEQRKALDTYLKELHDRKLMNEIQKMMFTEATHARFLAANDFDPNAALAHFQEFLDWRISQHVDKMLVNLSLKLEGARIHSLRAHKGVLPKWVP